MVSIVSLLVFIVLALAGGGAGTLATAKATPAWYGAPEKRRWDLPIQLLAPTWTFLYLLLAVAAWLVCNQQGLGLFWVLMFAIPLLLNILWAHLFFGLNRWDWALAEVVFTWIAVLATTITLWQIRAVASMLFVPFFLWVTYAVILSGSAWRHSMESPSEDLNVELKPVSKRPKRPIGA